MLSAVEQLLKKYQRVNRGTSPEARKWFSHNIYYLYMFRKCVLADLTEQTEQTKQNISLIRELIGDIIGAISLFAILFLALIFGGVLL